MSPRKPSKVRSRKEVLLKSDPSPPANSSFPDIFKLFHALIHVLGNLEGMTAHLRDAKRQYGGRPDLRAYVPPLALLERIQGRAPFEGQVQLRASLAREFVVPAHGDMPERSEVLSPVWLAVADQYWEWWPLLEAAIARANAHLKSVGKILDKGTPSLLDRPTTKLMQLLGRAASAARPHRSAGWNPILFPQRSLEEMVVSCQSIGQWIEDLRPLAHQRGKRRRPMRKARPPTPETRDRAKETSAGLSESKPALDPPPASSAASGDLLPAAPDKRPLKVPTPAAFRAWVLVITFGKKQTPAAAMMSTELKRTVGQAQVSRWVNSVKIYLAGGGVLPAELKPPPKWPAPARSVDPSKIELGRNQTGRSPHLRGRGGLGGGDMDLDEDD